MQNRPETTEASSDQPFSATLPPLIIDYFLFAAPSKDPLTLLLEHVARGEKNQAEKIIKIHPELLFESGNAEDSLGNAYVNYTPVQLARYMHDINMLKMMKPYLKQITNGEEQFVVTLQEAEEECKNQKPYNFKKLIDSQDFYDKKGLKKELHQFNEYCKPKVITNKKSFNMQDLFQAYAIYQSIGKSTSQYLTWDNQWNDEQRSFFLNNIIYKLLHSLPACYKHAFRNTSKNTVQKNAYDLNLLYQTKMTEICKLIQEIYLDHQVRNISSGCSLM